MENKLIMSVEEKQKYLRQLIGKVIKIMHLIQEEAETGYSPDSFICGQLFELSGANQLFDGDLTLVIVKLESVRINYTQKPFTEIRKQLLETKNLIERYLKAL